MCYNTNVKGGKSVFDHGAFLVNGVSDSGFTALFDNNNISWRDVFYFFITFKSNTPGIVPKELHIVTKTILMIALLVQLLAKEK